MYWVAGDADGEGAGGDATGVAVSGDTYGEGVAGDAPADVVGEGCVGGAPGVGVAGDVDGEGAAGDALVDGMSGDVLMVSVLLVMVVGVRPRMGGHRQFWVWGLVILGGGPDGRWWSVGSPILAVLVASGVGAAPRQSWRRVLMVRVTQVMVLSMSAASAVPGVAPGDVEGEGAVGDDAEGGWRCRW